MTVTAPHSGPRAVSPGRGGRVAAPAGLALLAAFGAAAVYALFVRTAPGQRVDELAMRGADVEHPRLVTLLGDTLDGTSLVSLALACLVAAGIGLLRGRVDLAVAAAVLVLGANVTTQALKLRLLRPVFDDAAANSLPSGHTTAAAATTFALILVLPQAVRALVALVGAGYIAVIAVATVWAGWHRPSDTVAALLVVFAWAAMVLAAVHLRRPTGGRPVGRLATAPLTAVAVAGSALAILGLAVLAVGRFLAPGSPSGTVAFLAGAAAICAATAFAVRTWLRLLGGDGAPAGDAPTGDGSAAGAVTDGPAAPSAR